MSAKYDDNFKRTYPGQQVEIHFSTPRPQAALFLQHIIGIHDFGKSNNRFILNFRPRVIHVYSLFFLAPFSCSTIFNTQKKSTTRRKPQDRVAAMDALQRPTRLSLPAYSSQGVYSTLTESLRHRPKLGILDGLHA